MPSSNAAPSIVGSAYSRQNAASSRLSHPGMAEGRQDVIVGGVLILAVVMEVFGRSHLLVSEDDILDGLVFDLLGAPPQ